MIADGIPLRWPCGPLELERAERGGATSARELEALRAFADPRSLEPLAGTPASCLVPTWATGSPRDEEQPRALAGLVAAAQARGLRVVGWVSPEADLGRAAATATAAGLAALATESAQEVTGIEVLRFGRGLAGRAGSGFLGVSDAVWPGLRATTPPGADGESGPTGPPWLDSNAWRVRLARALAAPRHVWLALEPPELGQPVPADAYVQAIADTALTGARGLLSLDPHLREGLVERRASALETLARIGRALAFFEEHRAWAGYQPVGELGVVSRYAGSNAFLSHEALNLLARQGVLYRVLVKEQALAGSWDELDAVLYVDAEPAAGELAARVYAFAERGGTAIVPPGWPARGAEEEAPWLPRYRVYRHGRGRLAVAREQPRDPFQLAEDARQLLGHRDDRLRVFNPGVSQLHYAVSGDGRAAVVHSLRYDTPSPRLPTTLWLRRAWAAARAWSVEGGAVPVEPRAVEPGVELGLPPVPVYCALEVSA